jgi:hypothetical protein
MRAPTPTLSAQSPEHPTSLEQQIAVAIVLWIILAGVSVVVANAWAMGMV